MHEHEDRVLEVIHACFMRGCAWQAFGADMVQAGADAPTWQSAYLEQNMGRVCMTKRESFYLSYIDVNEHEDRILEGVHACLMRGCITGKPSRPIR